jgi:tetratricopeptide (TPR) repeat protein
VASFESSEVALGPGDKLTYTALLLFGLVDDVGKFIFMKTGQYRVQALYYDAEGVGGTISSEPVTIRVIEPDGVDGQAQRLFVALEQGRLACGYGATRAARDSFQEILRKYPRSRYAPYAAYYLGLHYRTQGQHKQGIELLERILADYKGFPLKAELSHRLAITYYETGRKAEAKKLLMDLIAKEPHDVFARRAERLLRELESD